MLNEIINSGKLNIFQNNELKNALASLDAMLLKIRFQENEELARVRKDLIIIGEEKVKIQEPSILVILYFVLFSKIYQSKKQPFRYIRIYSIRNNCYFIVFINSAS